MCCIVKSSSVTYPESGSGRDKVEPSRKWVKVRQNSLNHTKLPIVPHKGDNCSFCSPSLNMALGYVIARKVRRQISFPPQISWSIGTCLGSNWGEMHNYLLTNLCFVKLKKNLKDMYIYLPPFFVYLIFKELKVAYT